MSNIEDDIESVIDEASSKLQELGDIWRKEVLIPFCSKNKVIYRKHPL
jgi:hypothetical protein